MVTRPFCGKLRTKQGSLARELQIGGQELSFYRPGGAKSSAESKNAIAARITRVAMPGSNVVEQGHPLVAPMPLSLAGLPRSPCCGARPNSTPVVGAPNGVDWRSTTM